MRSVKIGGAAYPLRLGMVAMRKIGKNYGGLSELSECLQSEDEDIQDNALYTLAYAMIENGIAAESFIHAGNPAQRPPLTSPEQIACLIGAGEYLPLYKAVTQVLTEEIQTTIQAETENTSGNAETTQEI